jgi:hypothetical protein
LTDRVKRAFRAWVLRLASRVDLAALHAAKVAAQRDDGSLDVEPDDPRLPPMTGVPLRQSVPGCDVRVAAGARVLVGFEVAAGEGSPRPDPSKPFAALWNAHDVLSVSIGAAGGRPVARQADPVTTDTLPPLSVVFTGTALGLGALVVSNTLPVSLSGFILTGSTVESA